MFGKNHQRTLSFENLESKELLAANTTVDIVDSTLRIIGDNGQNFVEIRDVAEGIEVHTRGSLLNGSPFERFVADKRLFSRIDIRLRGDLDSVKFENVVLDQHIAIRGGQGTDVFRFVNFSNMHTSRIPRVDIFGGTGSDEFLARSSWFDTLNVKLGEGSNLLSMDNSEVFKSARFEMMEGHDSIFVESNHFRRFVSFDTGDGGEFTRMERNKFAGSLTYATGRNSNGTPAKFTFDTNKVGQHMRVALGNERNQAIITTNDIGKNLFVDADPRGLSAGDDDEIRIHNSKVGGSLVVNGGSGNDFISVSRAEVASRLILRGFQGNDEIKVRRSEIGGPTEVLLDVGDDQLLIDHVFMAGDFRVNGSHGRDLIMIVGTEFNGNLKIEGGEGEDEISMILSDAIANAQLEGNGGNDYLFAFVNTFLGDTVINGNGGVNQYSAGLADPNEESNRFFGNLLKDNLTNSAAVDFRAILAEQRLPS